jgi:hypothetical protein
MNNRQLAQLIQSLHPKLKPRDKSKSPLDFNALEAELRQRYGSVSLALVFTPIAVGAYYYRKSQRLWPSDELYIIDYLLSNDLKSLTKSDKYPDGIDIPVDYIEHSTRLSNVS